MVIHSQDGSSDQHLRLFSNNLLVEKLYFCHSCVKKVLVLAFMKQFSSLTGN